MLLIYSRSMTQCTNHRDFLSYDVYVMNFVKCERKKFWAFFLYAFSTSAVIDMHNYFEFHCIFRRFTIVFLYLLKINIHHQNLFRFLVWFWMYYIAKKSHKQGLCDIYIYIKINEM